MRKRSDKTEIRRLRRLLREAEHAMNVALREALPPAAHAALVYVRRDIAVALAPKRPRRTDDR